MKGIGTLRIAVSSVLQTVEPIQVLNGVLKHRPPKSLEEVERMLEHHCAAVEDALAHVRRMIIARDAEPTAVELAKWSNVA